MNNLLGPGLAIGATIVLLLLRKLILSVAKKDRKTYGVRNHRRGVPDLEYEHSLRGDPIVGFEEPIPGATPIGVDEFLAELRAKAQAQSPSSRARNDSTTDFGRTQSNREEMAEDLW